MTDSLGLRNFRSLDQLGHSLTTWVMSLDMKYSFYDIVYKLTSQEPGQVVAYINNPDGSWQYEVDFQTSGTARLWEGQLTTEKPGFDMALNGGDEV